MSTSNKYLTLTPKRKEIIDLINKRQINKFRLAKRLDLVAKTLYRHVYPTVEEEQRNDMNDAFHQSIKYAITHPDEELTYSYSKGKIKGKLGGIVQVQSGEKNDMVLQAGSGNTIHATESKDAVTELYKELIEMKNKEIKRLEIEVETLKIKVTKLEKKSR